jgi:phosphatidylglycerophosphatase A
MTRLLGSCFGLGLAPWAPGTFGTLGGLLAAWLLPNDLALAGAAVVLFFAGVALANTLSEKDPGWYVLDEVVGYMLVPLFLGRSAFVLVGAFVCFRIFDIAKPWPIRRLEKLPGGWGIMIDDLWAAVYAHVLLRGMLWLI